MLKGGRVMVQVTSWPLTAGGRVRAGSVRVRFVADKVALGQVSLRLLRF
jgi:hypothetical protein